MSIFKSVLHALGSAATAVGHWFSNAFKWVETDGAKIAVAIIEELKTLFNSGAADFFGQIMDVLTKSNIPTEILDAIRKELPNASAIALGLQGLPADASDEAVANLANTILLTFNVTPDKSKFYSSLGASVIGIIRAHTMPGQVFTFATLVTDLEEAYQAYLSALNADQAGSTN